MQEHMYTYAEANVSMSTSGGVWRSVCFGLIGRCPHPHLLKANVSIGTGGGGDHILFQQISFGVFIKYWY